MHGLIRVDRYAWLLFVVSQINDLLTMHEAGFQILHRLGVILAGAKDPYALTSGNKQRNGWKWLGASDNHMSGDFWYNSATQMKMGYDCQAMYLYDAFNYGKWVGLPCHTAAPYVCEYKLVPHSSEMPSNGAEQMAILEMAQEAPLYLSMAVKRL